MCANNARSLARFLIYMQTRSLRSLFLEQSKEKMFERGAAGKRVEEERNQFYAAAAGRWK
jgi:hypothetical protein